MTNPKKTVLALYPNRFGVGYALFGSPSDLVEYGIGYVQPVSNKKSMKRIRKYLGYYRPDILIVRNVNDIKTRKLKRVEKLIDQICREARSQGLEVHSYDRTQIKHTFTQFGASSKYQIAQKLIEWYAELEKYQFPVRKRWMRENHNAGIFDAASLAITFYYLEE